MNNLSHNSENARLRHAVLKFFIHFALQPGDDGADPVATEFFARYPGFPKHIATEGIISAVTRYIDWTLSAMEEPDPVQLVTPSSSPTFRSFEIPQSPIPTAALRQVFHDEYLQGQPPNPRTLYTLASTCMISAFNFGTAIKGDNAVRTKLDRPPIPASRIAASSEFVMGIFLLSSLWYHYATPSSSIPVVAHWCSWFNDRIPGARAPPIPTPPLLFSCQPVYTANTGEDILATGWCFATRVLGGLQPTGYQAAFAEFYSMMALRAGLPLVACDGRNITDPVVVLQIAAQVAPLGHDSVACDQRGAAALLNGNMGRAWAHRFLAALRWYTCCAPSAIGLAIIPSGLYSFCSQRHGPGYWDHVRPKLVLADDSSFNFAQPVCSPTFWYDEAFNSCSPPSLQRCTHNPPPILDSPLIRAIEAVSSITKCASYDQWRKSVDTATAEVHDWLRDLAAHGQSDAMLHATAGAATCFFDLLSNTLNAIMGGGGGR